MIFCIRGIEVFYFGFIFLMCFRGRVLNGLVFFIGIVFFVGWIWEMLIEL